MEFSRSKRHIRPATSRMARTSHIRRQIAILESLPPGSLSASDRYAAAVAARHIFEIVRNGDNVDTVVNNGAVPALVKHLLRPEPHEAGVGIPYEYQVEESCALAISHILIFKNECADLFFERGILPLLVNLLNASIEDFCSIELKNIAYGAAIAIYYLAELDSIRTCVRNAGAIPPLVKLLESRDPVVLTSTACALQSLSCRNEENLILILESDALSKLIRLLAFEDGDLQRLRVSIIAKLYSSELSDDIKKKLQQAGALQPVINLLSSHCSITQRLSAWLIGIFADDPACRIHIAQRGAIEPLIEILSSPDHELKIEASKAIAILAQDEHNQVGIAYGGGMLPLLKNLGSKHEHIQDNSALALYRLVSNEENIHDFLKVGGVAKLLKTKFNTQFAEDYVSDTIEILQEKMTGQVLAEAIYLMEDNMEDNMNKKFQTSILLGLAHICSPNDLKTIFMDNNGLDILLDLLAHGNKSQQQISSNIFLQIDDKTAEPFPTKAGQHSQSPKMSSNELSGSNDECPDVTFVAEGRSFNANKTRLLASSSVFCAMIDGGYEIRAYRPCRCQLKCCT
uniref:BTB domain-containing protein n=1 Tax=Kalanchoe fedtschenkoi TaxID=63787 RepID=A0A7N0U2A6_KALFE